MLAFLLFLFLAVHIALQLYSRSVTDALGREAVRRAALGGGGLEAIDDADRWMRSQLGERVLETSWQHDQHDLVLRLRVSWPATAGGRLLAGPDEYESSHRLRIETGAPAP